jgi:putative nucleotidyltransferase with HDIG domain
MAFLNKTTFKRNRTRKNKNGNSGNTRWFADPDFIYSLLVWLLFVAMSIAVLCYDYIINAQFGQLLAQGVVITLICLTMGFHIFQNQKRLLKNRARAFGLVALLVVTLTVAKIAITFTHQTCWITASAVAVALIMAIAFDKRFAMAVSLFYCALAYFAAGDLTNFNLLLTMIAGAVPFCFFLKEIRTRMKLHEISSLAAVMVFLMASAAEYLSRQRMSREVFEAVVPHAAVTLVVGILIQGLLPLIEKVFHIATSMTLLDYSDANQPLLKRLAIEAPGTFSHSLFIGSIAEAAAERIGRNGLLCRVGSYYHDIGKLSKPGYFVENQLGNVSWHKELSPAMSQLIIVGHVKDGLELAEEYHLPTVLRQFIETHHGTTLVEYFYNEAVKQHEKNGSIDTPPPAESEFRYPGPRPRTKEAAIVMLADVAEGAVRALTEPTSTKIEGVVHNMAMKRLQDGQFDDCDLSLRELSQIEASMTKTLVAHYHGRIAYPKPPEVPAPQA